MNWPKGPTHWLEDRTLMVSVPFTWNLPATAQLLRQKSMLWDRAVVGGPAIDLMPDYLTEIPNVMIGHDCPGVLQRVNPLATRTTLGCVRRCGFCGIGQGKIERGGFRELKDWPDLPLICDNNLLAASISHFDRVMDRLERHVGVDFNQGIDSRLLNEHHAERLARLKRPKIRLALDSMAYSDMWLEAREILLCAGVKKTWVSSYAIVAFDAGPDEAWERCNWIEKWGHKAYPMWFHRLDCLRHNEITRDQRAIGWDNYERKRIMRWFYKHTKETN